MTSIANLQVDWTVPTDHPAFPGHFPGNPIVPGVVILDQALVFLSDAIGKPITHCKLGSAKFLNPVGPGETLAFQYAQRAGAIQVSVKRGEQPVATASITLLEESAE
ncbi:MAG TPA: hypothetical protein VFW68_00755 [Rhodocyclaceae bacterium]|nr:hypothetical protein [Rhodocyclaceae bacterium]